MESESPTDAATAAAAVETIVAALPPTDAAVPTDRDIVFGSAEPNRKSSLLLSDLIRLHRLLWHVHEKPEPEKDSDVEEMAKHILKTLRDGKPFELAGVYDVPRPFLKSSGRFFQEEPTTGIRMQIGEDVALQLLIDRIRQDFREGDEVGNLNETPFSDLKAWVFKQAESHVMSAEIVPEGNDAMLLRCTDSPRDKMYEQQYGNKILFNLVSHLVTPHVIDHDRRVDTALNLMKGLDESAIESVDKRLTTTKNSRFLIRKLMQDQTVAWEGKN